MRLLLLAIVAGSFAFGCAAEPADEDVADSDVALTGSSQRDPVVDQARADRLVGEQTNGYLGLVAGDARGDATAPRDLSAHVSQINIKRRAVYTQVAADRHSTVATVAESTACILLGDRVRVGEAYRAEDGTWRVHTASDPVELPSRCGR